MNKNQPQIKLEELKQNNFSISEFSINSDKKTEEDGSLSILKKLENAKESIEEDGFSLRGKPDNFKKERIEAINNLLNDSKALDPISKRDLKEEKDSLRTNVKDFFNVKEYGLGYQKTFEQEGFNVKTNAFIGVGGVVEGEVVMSNLYQMIKRENAKLEVEGYAKAMLDFKNNENAASIGVRIKF